MQSSSRKIVVGTAVFVITMVTAVVGYWLAGWSLLEAIYMAIITIYGVGYGEVRPVEDPALRIFTIVFIVAGCTSAVFVMGGFVQMIAEGEIKKALGARRMTEGIKRLKDHVIICGFGRVGQILAAELREAGLPFVIVDTNSQRLLEAEEFGDLVYIGDATEETTLSAVGIANAKTLASVLPNDAANVFITLSARELNNTIKIIARGESPSTKRKLLRSGANEVVMPAAVGAHRISQLIRSRSETSSPDDDDLEFRINQNLGSLGLKILEVAIEPNSHLVGLPIGEIEKRAERGVVVVSILGSDGTKTRVPSRETVVKSGDVLALIGHPSTMKMISHQSKSGKLIYRGTRVE